MKNYKTQILLGMALGSDAKQCESRVRSVFAKRKCSAIVALIVLMALVLTFVGCFTTACVPFIKSQAADAEKTARATPLVPIATPIATGEPIAENDDSGCQENLPQVEPAKMTPPTTPKRVFITGTNEYYIDTDNYLWIWNKAGKAFSKVSEDIRFTMITDSSAQAGSYKRGDYMMGIDTDGRLWAWGSATPTYCNNKRATPVTLFGKGVENSDTPIHIFPEMTFKYVSGAGGSVLAIDTEGKLWSWGVNRYGQLGTGDTEYSDTPINIIKDKRFTMCVAIDDSGFALDTDGHIWVWGTNYGMFGDGKTDTVSATWDELYKGKKTCADLPKIGGGEKTYTTFSIKYTTVVAIDTDGHLWVWGGGFACACEDNQEVVASPKSIMPEKTFKLCQEHNYGALAVDTDGRVWTWGYASHAQLGHTDIEEPSEGGSYSIVPHNIMPNVSLTDICKSGSGTVALDTEGNIWYWGVTNF